VNPFLLGKPRPIVVGHRGVPALHQENTLAGIRRAIALGIPAVEIDVQLTKDRRAVVIHDHPLDRLTGDRRRIFDLTWDEVARLRIRRELPMGIDVHGQRVVKRYEREEPISLLEEVLAESGTLAFNIELKMTFSFWQTEIARVVARVLAAARAEDRVIVTSFDPRKLRATFDAHPALTTGYCFSDNMLNFVPLVDRARLLSRIVETHPFGGLMRTRVLGAEHTIVGRQLVERLHARGVSIGTHTIFPIGSTTGKAISPTGHAIAEIERLVASGVDWIETDDPERLQQLLG
jgi:glycerophosphoryl diester phosphodiesterase